MGLVGRGGGLLEQIFLEILQVILIFSQDTICLRIIHPVFSRNASAMNFDISRRKVHLNGEQK
jgi:hypothetical protein